MFGFLKVKFFGNFTNRVIGIWENRVRKNTGIPVIANDQLEDPKRASDIIGSDQADLVTLGKGALANHDWVYKVQRGEAISELVLDRVLRPDATIKDFEINS